MTTAIGELTTRVRLEKAVRTPNGSGGFTTSWSHYATLWAKEIDLGPDASEQPADAQRPSRRSIEFTTHRRTDLSSDMRVIRGGKVLSILEVVGDPVSRAWTMLRCVEDPGVAR